MAHGTTRCLAPRSPIPNPNPNPNPNPKPSPNPNPNHAQWLMGLKRLIEMVGKLQVRL